MSRKSAPPSGIGLVSLFTVLMVLCVAVFAVLSLASARADWRITQRNGEAVSAYYQADAHAARAAACLADELWPTDTARPASSQAREDLEQILGITAQVLPQGEGLEISFTLLVDEIRAMNVVIHMPQGGTCELLSRSISVQEGAEPPPNDSLPVWTGESP